MAVNNSIPAEVEVFGVTYERYALQKFFIRLKNELKLGSVIELPASGAKAMSSLYSLGFAVAGCHVTLVDADPEGLVIWRELGLERRMTTLASDQLDAKVREGWRWDLCWNFMIIPTQNDPYALLRRMKECSRRYVMLVNVNRFNVGFHMHCIAHRLWNIEWTHGNVRFFSPFKTAPFLRHSRVRPIDWGVVDCPPWPDSPGFRDLRLHRQADTPRRWICPYVGYLKNGQFPSWVRWVYLCERIPIPSLLKLPYSHLFYILGQVYHEAN